MTDLAIDLTTRTSDNELWVRLSQGKKLEVRCFPTMLIIRPFAHRAQFCYRFVNVCERFCEKRHGLFW